MNTAIEERTPVVPEDFAIFEGGPLLSFARRWPALRPWTDSGARRALLVLAITWLPLLLLSLQGGVALGGVALPFLLDIQTQIRLLLALPLLIVGAHQAHGVLTPMMEVFAERGIVPEKERAPLTNILASASRWNHAWTPRLLLIAVVWMGGHAIWQQKAASQVAAWYGSSSTGLTPAGWWFVWIAVPVSQFVQLLWLLRIALWTVVLARISSLGLHLVPTHPDRAGGLGFLGTRTYAFVPFALAEGTFVAGVLANRIFHEGRSLPQFGMEIAGVAVFVLALVMGPLCVFTPRLVAAKLRGWAQYGGVANRYVREFEHVWVDSHASPERELLGSSDVQSLADMANSYDVITRMRPVPFSERTMLMVLASFLLPIVPLWLTVFPAEQLVKQLVQALL